MRGIGCVLVVVIALMLFSFADGTRSLQQLKNSVKPSIAPGKPSFFVSRGTPTTCKDFLKPILQPTEGGLLRGVGFGMPQEQVLELEQRTEHLKADYKLVYDHGLEENVKALLTYDFNHNNQLDAISIDYFAADALTSTCILNEYVGYFNARYGTAQLDEEGYWVWEINDYAVNGQAKISYKIYLKDVTARDDAGVSLQFITQLPAMP